MKYRFFHIPATMPEVAQEELNRFCAEQQVVSLDKNFVQDGERSYWALCVCYLDSHGGPVSTRKGKIDYREVLSPPDFALYAKLRDLRRTISQTDKVPAYALFTNDQLADIVTNRVRSKSELAKIDGVGAARVEKYGDAFIKLLRDALPDASEKAEESPKP